MDYTIRPLISNYTYDLNTVIKFARITSLKSNLLICDLLILGLNNDLILFSKNVVFTQLTNNVDILGMTFGLFYLFLYPTPVLTLLVTEYTCTLTTEQELQYEDIN